MVAQSILESKKESVSEIADIAKQSHSLVAAHYRGMSVSEMTAMRSESRKLGVRMKIVKNTLARRALAESQYAQLAPNLTGPVVLCFSLEEPNAAAQLVMDFMKKSKVLKVHSIGLESKVLAPEEIDKVAKMPNKQQAIAMLLGVMQAPVTGLACAMKETAAKLVRTVSEVAKLKQAKNEG